MRRLGVDLLIFISCICWQDEITLSPVLVGAKAQGKGLSAFDDRALREAQNLLHSEFAYILGIEPNAVPAFIAGELGE